MSTINSSSNTLKGSALKGNILAENTLRNSTAKEPENEAITENHISSKSHFVSHQASEKVELGAETNPSFDTLALSAQQRHLITQAGQQQLAFPLQWVSEIMLVEQSHILSLPFYDPMLLGILHYKGDIVPLMVAPLASKATTAAFIQSLKTKRTLTAIRLNQAAGKQAGVGLVVDRVIERTANHAASGQSSEQGLINAASATSQTLPGRKVITQAESSVQIFQLEDIPPTIWQPR